MEYDGMSWAGSSIPGPTHSKGVQLKYTNSDPAIAYGSRGSGLIFTVRENSWDIVVVDNTNVHGSGDHQTIGLEFDGQGNPHIAYLANGTFRYAFFNGADWIVDDLGLGSLRADLELDKHDNPFNSYQRGNDVYLGYMDGTDWIFGLIAPGGVQHV